jgi:2,4-dienoyl-CoA reductase-like NADH-dependent reductase (Old Yellow Enzyme family)
LTGSSFMPGTGYLPDHLQNGSNRRTDAYGGPIENRSRFLLEVVEAMVAVWDGNRVAVRIAPGGTWNSMSDSNPTAYTFDSRGRSTPRRQQLSCLAGLGVGARDESGTTFS